MLAVGRRLKRSERPAATSADKRGRRPPVSQCPPRRRRGAPQLFRGATICGVSPHEKNSVRASRLPADTGGAGATPRSAVVPALEEWARSPIVGRDVPAAKPMRGRPGWPAGPANFIAAGMRGTSARPARALRGVARAPLIKILGAPGSPHGPRGKRGNAPLIAAPKARRTPPAYASHMRG